MSYTELPGKIVLHISQHPNIYQTQEKAKVMVLDFVLPVVLSLVFARPSDFSSGFES